MSEVPLTTSRPELLGLDGTDARFRVFVHDLLAFGSRLRDVRDSLAQIIGLSGPAYTIMISIAHLERSGEVGITQLARHLNVSQPFVTAEVAKLANAGLVEKAASATDGRSVRLRVLPRGRQLLEELAPHQRPVNDLLFGSLDEHTFNVMADAVSTLVADVEHALDVARSRTTDRLEAS